MSKPSLHNRVHAEFTGKFQAETHPEVACVSAQMAVMMCNLYSIASEAGRVRRWP